MSAPRQVSRLRLLSSERLYASSAHAPGYLLPTATGGFVGSIAASEAHLHLLAQAWFGVGMVSWLLVASIILNRLFVRPPVPPGLTPTLALEAGPPMVAGVAYHALHGGTIDTFAAALGGYAILMVLVQLRLVGTYTHLSFSPAFWSFTFPTAALGLDGITWLQTTRPTGYTAYIAIVLGFVSLAILGIAARSAVAVSRRGIFFGLKQSQPLTELRTRSMTLTLSLRPRWPTARPGAANGPFGSRAG